MMEWSLLHTTLNNGESRSKACLSHLIILGNRKAKLQGWKKGLVIKLSLQDRPSYFQLCHVSTSASFDTSSLDSIYITFPVQEQNIISSPLCRKHKILNQLFLASAKLIFDKWSVKEKERKGL